MGWRPAAERFHEEQLAVRLELGAQAAADVCAVDKDRQARAELAVLDQPPAQARVTRFQAIHDVPHRGAFYLNPGDTVRRHPHGGGDVNGGHRRLRLRGQRRLHARRRHG